MSEQLPAGSVELSAVEIEGLDARWSDAWTPGEVARRLAGVAVPWYVAAGWALDLFRGAQSREHGDIEIAVPSARFSEIRGRLAEGVFDAVGDGRIWENGAPEALAVTHQTWLRDPDTGRYLLDVFREPHDGDTWICRRDESIRLPYGDVIRYTDDEIPIPYLVPELVLLFKAKDARAKDQADFEGTLPRMTSDQRETLRKLIERVHPGHSWLAGL